VPDHPDREQLAAFQAGDVDRRQRADVEAHLSGCRSCTEAVASVEHARGRLALLEEPELPSGLHDRLAAAIDAEAETVRVLPRRPTPWYRRPAAFAAAAALLLITLAAPLLDQDSAGDRTTADAGGGSQAAQEAANAQAFAAGLPVIQAPGEVSAVEVRSRLAADPQAKLALERARAASRRLSDSGTGPASSAQGSTAGAQREGAEATGGRTAAPPAADAAGQQACLAAATATAGKALQPLVPAFFVEGLYRGRQATVLVTTSPSEQGRTDLWVFPRGNCSVPPLATERVR
jgi:putative zinc finger protein